MSDETTGVPRLETIRDRVDEGIAAIRESAGADEFESEGFSSSLTDVDGIGPATAEKLRDAGIERPVELARVTPTQIEAIDGIGAKTADALAKKFQFRRSGRFGQPDVPEKVREAHADRSPEARRADRSFNAETTLDGDEWLDDPNGLDYPGVDTVPEQRRAERTREKARRAGVTVELSSLPGQQSGEFSAGTTKVDPASSFDPVSSLAHEVGHAADSQLGSSTDRLSDSLLEDDELRDEAESLAVRRRATVSSADQIESAYNERDVPSELFADAFAVATEEPRAAKREAPNLVREIEDKSILDFGRF